jgi:hypothetical protein
VRTAFTRAALCGLLVALCAPAAPAANQKDVDRAIKGGADFFKARYGRAGGAAPAAPAPGAVVGDGHGIGPTCLAGLAMLEAGVPIDDPAVKNVTAQVRRAAYAQGSTYQVALCLMYLDRFGDKNDLPLIQALAVRLLVGQTRDGGWGYQCCGAPSPDDQKRLAEMKAADVPAGNLHPEVEKYAQALTAARGAAGPGGAAGGPVAGVGGDDNSNTQFAVLAVWMARKHGVPVEGALDLIERRFLATQDARSGTWPYSGTTVTVGSSSPSMYCAGLISMATAVARREERRKGEAKPDAPPKKETKPDGKPVDPFFNPPAGTAPPPKKDARPADARDRCVQLAFAGLGLTLADMARNNGVLTANGTHGRGDLYFLWSLERVGVVYGADKIGGLDWYDVGSTLLVRSQGNDGGWSVGGYSAEINTAFAVLFLCRSNLARDLSSKVQRDPTSTELRAGTGPNPTDLLPNRPTLPTAPAAAIPVVELPNPTNDPGVELAVKMLKASKADWANLLQTARDAKGASNTRAMVLAATHALGAQKGEVREALAERLCRMTPDTLRAMMKADEAELRRAAALACGMKDDKAHVPDLIELIIDPSDDVTRAAKAALKSLTAQDHGPPAGASAGQKALALTAWREWHAGQKK